MTIMLHADKKTLYADGQEICFIELRLAGENGITKSSVDRKVSVEVSGVGTLQGFGSSVSNTDDSFLSGMYSIYYGKALIAVRAQLNIEKQILSIEEQLEQILRKRAQNGHVFIVSHHVQNLKAAL